MKSAVVLEGDNLGSFSDDLRSLVLARRAQPVVRSVWGMPVYLPPPPGNTGIVPPNRRTSGEYLPSNVVQFVDRPRATAGDYIPAPSDDLTVRHPADQVLMDDDVDLSPRGGLRVWRDAGDGWGDATGPNLPTSPWMDQTLIPGVKNRYLVYGGVAIVGLVVLSAVLRKKS